MAPDAASEVNPVPSELQMRAGLLLRHCFQSQPKTGPAVVEVGSGLPVAMLGVTGRA
jgi:hypothetical protein